MSEKELLSSAEVRDVTDCARVGDQCKKLDAMGLPYRLVGKSVKISRYHLREWLCGRAVKPTREPNMAAVR